MFLASLAVAFLGLCLLPNSDANAEIVADEGEPVSKKPRNWKTGEMILACGASQSGKTYWVREQLKGAKRVLVWDCEAQYEDICPTVITNLTQLGQALKRNPKNIRISYQPTSLKDFEGFCKWAFFFCDCGLEFLEPNGEPMKTFIVAEEISDVTSPSKAPNGWGILLRRGLKRHATIIGITQRPSESDKTIIGNCSQMHVCGMSRNNDMAYMARELNVPLSDVQSIDRSKYQFIHKFTRTGEITRGGL